MQQRVNALRKDRVKSKVVYTFHMTDKSDSMWHAVARTRSRVGSGMLRVAPLRIDWKDPPTVQRA